MTARREAALVLGCFATSFLVTSCASEVAQLRKESEVVPMSQRAPEPGTPDLRIADKGQNPATSPAQPPAIKLVAAQQPAPAVQEQTPPQQVPFRLPFESTLTPGNPAPAALSVEKAGNDGLHQLARLAIQRYAGMDSYIVRLRRREMIANKEQPEEILLLKFRKQPWSIYFKWLGSEGAGREVTFVKGLYEGKLHTLLAAGDVPLMPAGKRISLAPDSALIRSSSRHAITEAGIGNLVERFAAMVEATDRGDPRMGTLRYLGPVKRPEYETACESAEQIIPPGAEAELPRGGRRLWVFEGQTRLPLLVLTADDTGREVEYYCYDRLQYPVRLDEDDFNPDKMGKTRP